MNNSLYKSIARDCPGRNRRRAVGVDPVGSEGFTLIEVVIALAVLAISMGAVIGAITHHVNSVAYLRDRTLAHWVAMNKIAEMQLSDSFPKTSESSGSTVMADAEWRWTLTVSETPDQDVRRLDVAVGHEGEDKNPLAKMIAYLGRPRH